MTTMTITHADWEALEGIVPTDVTVVSVTGSLITAQATFGAGQVAEFLISGSWTGVSGTSLAGLNGTVSGISLSIDGVSQFDATGLAVDISEVREDLFVQFHDVIELALGEDVNIEGSEDDDSVSGSAGDDTVHGHGGDDDLLGDLGDDSMDGGDGRDSLDGGAGDDSLRGGGGDDNIRGGSGHDRLNAGAGVDTLAGGGGNDTYYVDASDSIVELAGSGTDTEVCNFTESLDDNVENLVLTGTAAVDGTGNHGHNSLTGNSGSNTLVGELGDDRLAGGGGDDELRGGSGSDRLTGGSGNDDLWAGAGTDTLSGGIGDDTYYVDSISDDILETAGGGNDTQVCNFSDTLDDSVENLTLTGSAAIDGTGNTAANALTGNLGDNRLSGGLGNDRLRGRDGTDSLNGGHGADDLDGGTGDDRLAAGVGDDSMVGGAGDDLLIGGTGDDDLTGGSGSDKFRFDTLVAGDVDTIDDFSSVDDTIQLENAVFTAFGTSTGTVAAGNFSANAAGVAQDADDFLVYDTDSGALFYDADGSGAGASVQVALMGTGLALTNADFALV